MKIAVIGATGMVGQTMLKVLEKQNIIPKILLPVASQKSLGKTITFAQKTFPVVSMEEALAAKPNLALFSAGGNVSKQWAPRFAEMGTTVIDNSSFWRMDPSKKLIVPEINADLLTPEDKIIANPNCSTIQLVMVLAPLHKAYEIKRVVISTYQSVTGTGKKAVDQMFDERANRSGEKVYPHKIDLNVLPHIDVFLDNGYTKEEMKMIEETNKILQSNIAITATAVRIPTMGGHSESVNVCFNREFKESNVREIMEKTPGVLLQDNPSKNLYPMPLNAENQDAVFVGRIRRDYSQDKSLNMWIVADNLRKGAATNAVQIARFLIDKQYV